MDNLFLVPTAAKTYAATQLRTYEDGGQQKIAMVVKKRLEIISPADLTGPITFGPAPAEPVPAPAPTQEA